MAAEETHRKIIVAFLELLRRGWFEDVKLEQVARAAGVTVQTVIRRFGGKDGLLREATDVLELEVMNRRAAAPQGAVARIVAVLVDDYEHQGDLVIRLLAQEPRHEALRPLLDHGRKSHRRWVAGVFAPWLERLSGAARDRRLTALVAATDVYVWKLLRRDLGLSERAVAGLMADLVTGGLEPSARVSSEERT